ncbi:MAG: hypothetical protein OYM47_17190 [Gemmatimonadota bacterium]|nr:hypothetical protein [Gemmatimonadota bacterium]
MKLLQFICVECDIYPEEASHNWLIGNIGERVAKFKKMDEAALKVYLWDACRRRVLDRNSLRKDVRALAEELGLDWKRIDASAKEALRKPDLIKDLNGDQEAPKG